MLNPVTLITGTRKGIGKSLAEYYVNKGHDVIGCSRLSPDWTLPNYIHFNSDVTNEASVKKIFKYIKTNYGYLTNLINNAGVAAMNHSILTPTSTVEHILDTNILGTFLFCREAAKVMRKNNYGRIVNFSTVAVPLKLEGEAIYAASKSAIIKLTQILAKELSAYHITINAIGPTPVDTDLIKGVPIDKINKILNKQPIHRMGNIKDIINVMDFFLDEQSDFITGQTIYLGGVQND